jgi:hypothetical protein
MLALISVALSIDLAQARDLIPIVTQAAAQPFGAIGVAPTEPSSLSSSVVDFSPTIEAVSHVVFVALAAVVSYWAQSHIRDQADRDNFDTLIQKGVSLGMAKEAAALKGHPLTADVGSAVAAHAIAFAQEQEPAMIKRLGLDDTDVAQHAIAALPAVDGPVHTDTVKGIANAAEGGPVATPDLAAITAMFERGLTQAVEAVVNKQYAGAAPAPKPPAPIQPVT